MKVCSRTPARWPFAQLVKSGWVALPPGTLLQKGLKEEGEAYSNTWPQSYGY